MPAAMCGEQRHLVDHQPACRDRSRLRRPLKFLLAEDSRPALALPERRLVLDDAFLSAELKRLRHELTSALGELPAGLLLEARDTLGDVGTAISTAE